VSIRDQLLPMGKAARSLGISVDTMRRTGRVGHIAEYRDHRGVRHYRRSDLIRLRDSRLPRLRSVGGQRSRCCLDPDAGG